MNIANILNQVYANVVPFVTLLGILIFVHELGHFLVARMCGVRVEVFSLGFGKKLFSYKKGDTTYCISLVPLGGYVKMFGEQNGDVVSDADRPHSFTHKTVWQRIAVVLAGPLMNFFFAVFVFSLISEMGEESRAPIVAEVEANSAAAQMGLRSGDKVLEVAGEKVRSYEEFQKVLNVKKGLTIGAVVESASNEKKMLTLQVASTKNPNIFSLDDMIGSIEGIQPVAMATLVGVNPHSEAAHLGFKTGDEIIEANSKKISKWSELNSLYNKKEKLSLKVQRIVNADTEEKTTFDVEVAEGHFAKFKDLAAFGLTTSELYLDQVIKGSPAEAAGLKRFDKLVSINGTSIQKWEQVLNTIKSFNGKEPLAVVFLRDGKEVTTQITPQVTSQTTAFGQEDKRYTIGIMPLVQFAPQETVIVHSGSLFESLEKGFDRTWDISAMTVISFVKLFQGEVSHKNIGGMISIGKAAKDSFEMGMQSFLMTMGILSVSLFILNLLPIPVLDGGHLVFYTIEVIKGSPLSVKKMELAQQVGFVLLMGLMVLALFNDFTKFFFKT